MRKKTFNKILDKVINSNHYDSNMITATLCDAEAKWTPVDLILRETLNNNGMSAKGFLGISRRDCLNAYDYIVSNKDYFIRHDLVNKEACNNIGFPLWDDYDF